MADPEPGQGERPPEVGRRRFLRLLAASLALAGAAGCAPVPDKRIVPYVRAPEQIVPGRPLHFATAMEVGGYGLGLLVESHEGRPTKVEGNPDHPASMGATDAMAQAAALTLYDPERSATVREGEALRSRQQFLEALAPALDGQAARGGAGLRILTESVSSPTLAAQIDDLLATFPEARWHQFEPVSRAHALQGATLAFGEPLEARYHFDRAEVILALDGDFLECIPRSLRYVHDFADRRRISREAPEEARMNRLYAVESTASLTGAAADHRWPVRPSEVEGIARRVAAELGVRVDAPAGRPPATLPPQWLEALTGDLLDHRGSSLVVAGDTQPPVVHALAHAMNEALGNAGETVTYTQPVIANPVNDWESLRELVDDMVAQRVELLVILGGNPAYTSPADIDFAAALTRVPFSTHLSLYVDETSARSTWHLPQAHFLESWSDTRAFDGSVSIVQPLIRPLYNGISAHELLAALAGEPERGAHSIVREHWRESTTAADFDLFWREALRAGVVSETAFEVRSPRVRPLEEWAPDSSAGGGGGEEDALEIVFRPDPNIYDGRFVNNGWLQELPKPLSTLTWDNAAIFSPVTAGRLGIENEDLVTLALEGRSVAAPAWILPGQPDGAVTAYLGYGQGRAGGIGARLGYDAYAIRTSDRPWFARGLSVERTGERYGLAVTQEEHDTGERHIVREASLREYRERPDFVSELPGTLEPERSLYPEYRYPDHAWGMAIDLSVCTGCNACVIACQAENNIPIVGKEQVQIGRRMHWLRVDAYLADDAPDGIGAFMPVPCMHCENAPCEYVCPVNATVHSAEGLNDMIYNRCIGTRYCSNNCPYKVRRFNFLEFADFEREALRPLYNPDVTVRSRGVMEKCTYCVQRINQARIQASIDDRPIRDGEIRTACQDACPTQAIVFGDINDPAARVSRMKATPLDYALLAELNTRPRTTYLGMVRNPNPALAEG